MVIEIKMKKISDGWFVFEPGAHVLRISYNGERFVVNSDNADSCSFPVGALDKMKVFLVKDEEIELTYETRKVNRRGQRKKEIHARSSDRIVSHWFVAK